MPWYFHQKLLSRNFVLILGVGATFAASLHLTLPVFPLFWENQGYAEDSIGTLLALMPLATIVTMPMVGKLVDRHGARRFVLPGLALYGLPFAFYPLGTLLPFTVLLRLLQGVGLGFFIPAFYKTLSDLSPPRRRGEAMGWFGVTKSVIFAVFPGFGLYLLPVAGDASAFWVATLICAGGLGLAHFLPQGTVPVGPQATPPSLRAVLRLPAVLLAILILFTLTMAYGTTNFVPLFTAHRDIGGLSGFYAVTALAMLLGSFLGGRLSDRWGRTQVILPALLTLSLGLAVFSQAQTTWHLWGGALLFGWGFGAGQAVTNAFVIDQTDPQSRGTAIGVYQSAFDLGLGFGQMSFGLAVSAFSYAWAFSRFSLVAMVSLIVVALWLPLLAAPGDRPAPAPVPRVTQGNRGEKHG